MYKNKPRKRARVLIVDDHPTVREGLAMRVGREPDLEVCGEAADMAEALRLVAETEPDVAVIDISLKTGNGIDLIKRIKDRDDHIGMLVWSMHGESLYAERALRAGALGYVNKDQATDKIIEAIRRVLEGKVFLSETAIVLGSGNRVIVAYNDTGSEIPLNGISEANGYSVSTNGGSRFEDRGTVPLNPWGFGFDPVLARSDRTGTIFLSTISFAQPFGLFTGRINIFRSLDDGGHFELPVNGTPGFVPGVDWLDKEWMAVDNFDGAGFGNAYLVTTNFTTANGKAGIYLTRSTDDGVTWGPNGGTLIAPGGNTENGYLWTLDPYVTVGPDHTVYVFWFDYHDSAIRMRKSTDQGMTFGDAVTVTGVEKHSQGGDLGLTGASGNGFRADPAPQAVVNPVTGDIYLIYADNPKSAKDRADIYFVQSTDGGQTWSPRRRVNDDLTSTDQWQPALAVTPDGSRVGMFWYDRRLDSANNLIDRYGVIGAVSGHDVTFEPNFRITNVSFPPVFGQDLSVSSNYMGDYDQVVADNDYFYTTWGDNRLANPNYAAHEYQPDVRFAKIPVDWAGDVAALAAASAPPIVDRQAQNRALRQESVQPLFTEAPTRWAMSGINVSSLQNINVRITNLGGTTFGLAPANNIWLDGHAIGRVWFVDATLWESSEFTTPGEQGEQNRLDLLTAGRLLEDYVRRVRGDVKHREGMQHGRVVRLIPQDGCGFLETRDGREVYFHRHSVLDHAFADLQPGDEVAFSEELGNKDCRSTTGTAICRRLRPRREASRRTCTSRPTGTTRS